jgi:hypothetical protein
VTSNIEVLIPTLNEEANLPHALRSVVGWADHVHVIDAGLRGDPHQRRRWIKRRVYPKLPAKWPFGSSLCTCRDWAFSTG